MINKLLVWDIDLKLWVARCKMEETRDKMTKNDYKMADMLIFP